MRSLKLYAQGLGPGSLGNRGVGEEESRVCSCFMTSLSSESHEQDYLMWVKSLLAYEDGNMMKTQKRNELGIVSNLSPYCSDGSEFVLRFSDSKNKKANVLG